MYTVGVHRRVAAALLCLAAGATLLGADRDAFSVGVLRRDGVVIPFARFDGKHWQTIWIDAAPDVEVPIDLRNVPKKWWGSAGPLDTWQATTAAPDPLTLHVRQPDLIAAQCLRQVGLRTDYRPPEPSAPPREGPYPKDGLAVAPPQKVARIEILGASSPEWTEFGPLVTDGFNKSERSIAAESGHPVITTKEREATNPQIEAIYAYGKDPRTYYVEAAREYWSDPKTNECRAVAFGHVWLSRDVRGLKLLRATINVMSCDRDEASYMLPLGVITAGGHAFWIAQIATWNLERYDVIEITPAGAVVIAGRFGGGC